METKTNTVRERYDTRNLGLVMLPLALHLETREVHVPKRGIETREERERRVRRELDQVFGK